MSQRLNEELYPKAQLTLLQVYACRPSCQHMHIYMFQQVLAAAAAAMVVAAAAVAVAGQQWQEQRQQWQQWQQWQQQRRHQQQRWQQQQQRQQQQRPTMQRSSDCFNCTVAAAIAEMHLYRIDHNLACCCCFLQACFLALAKKRVYIRKDSDVDADCRHQHGLFLPPGNRHPRSIGVLKRLLGCKATQEVSCKLCHDSIVLGLLANAIDESKRM